MTANASPKARETAVNHRSGQDPAEVPPMKEQPEVGGGKLVDEQLTTRSSVRNTPTRPPAGEPATEATRRRRHKNRRRSSTHVVESPSKAAGQSVTLALDADSTAANLGYYHSNNLTGGNEEAALPQREETLQPHPKDNGRMGDNKRPQIILPLTPGSPATLPIPQADRGGHRPHP